MERKNRPGTKSEDLYTWEELDLKETRGSTFALQQHLQQLIRKDPSAIDNLITVPEGEDKDVWINEHLRQVVLELNGFLAMLQDVCTRESCPQMKATEDCIFYCATHPEPKECCAIDYMLHTTDGACAMLNSNKHFSSRMTVSAGAAKGFPSVSRRLYRIWAHAYFHHKEEFLAYEEEHHLCERFTKFATMYKLIPAKLLVIPLFH